MEKKLSNWFIKQMMDYDIIFDGDLSDINFVFDVELELGIYGKINNMNFELNNNTLILTSNNGELFDSKVYDKNINYYFSDKIIFRELYDIVLKYRTLVLKEKNSKQLNQFDFENENNNYNLLIKSKFDINDVNFEYIGKSRIDNQKIYNYKTKLPKYEYIKSISNYDQGVDASIQF